MPENGTLEMICAFGFINIDEMGFQGVSGIISLYLRRNTLMKINATLRQSRQNTSEVCNKISVPVIELDEILIYIPTSCRPNGRTCPLQVNINSPSSVTEYYDGSDSAVKGNDNQLTVINSSVLLNVWVTMRGMMCVYVAVMNVCTQTCTVHLPWECAQSNFIIAS